MLSWRTALPPAIAIALSMTAGTSGGTPQLLPFGLREPLPVCQGMGGKASRGTPRQEPAAGLARDRQLARTAVVALEDELDLFEKLGLMEGHLTIGKALLDAGMTAHALPHFGHPLSEIYDYLKPALRDRNYPEFEAELRALEAQARAAPGTPATEQAYAAVLARIEGLRRTIPAALGTSPAFIVRGIALMMAASADDLAESIEKGRIANSVEYHDAMGFARYAGKVLAANRSLLGARAEAIAAELQRLLSAFPALTPPGEAPRNVADLAAAAERVRALAP